MVIIAPVGPNAVGKTTAARRLAARYPMITACLTDARRVIEGGVERVEEACWKRERARLANKYRRLAEGRVVLVEGASGYGLAVGEACGADRWVVVTCEPADGYALRRDRCERLGKPFKVAVWAVDGRNLEYESGPRLLNYARGRLEPSRWTHFVVTTDLTGSWAPVDEFLGSLVRRAVNGLNRRRT